MGVHRSVRCGGHRRPAVVARHADVRARLQQHAHHRLVPFLRGDEQRGRAAVVSLVHVRAELHEQPHSAFVLHLRGEKQRRGAVVVCFVDIRPELHEHPDHRLVALLRREQQRRGAVSLGFVHVSALLNKRAHHIMVAASRGDVKRRHAVIRCGRLRLFPLQAHPGLLRKHARRFRLRLVRCVLQSRRLSRRRLCFFLQPRRLRRGFLRRFALRDSRDPRALREHARLFRRRRRHQTLPRPPPPPQRSHHGVERDLAHVAVSVTVGFLTRFLRQRSLRRPRLVLQFFLFRRLCGGGAHFPPRKPRFLTNKEKKCQVLRGNVREAGFGKARQAVPSPSFRRPASQKPRWLAPGPGSGTAPGRRP